jgi:hypothetical protein
MPNTSIEASLTQLRSTILSSIVSGENRSAPKPIGKLPRSLFRFSKPDMSALTSHLGIVKSKITKSYGGDTLKCLVIGANEVTYRGTKCFYIAYTMEPKDSAAYQARLFEQRAQVSKARKLHKAMLKIAPDTRTDALLSPSGIYALNSNFTAKQTKTAYKRALTTISSAVKVTKDIHYAVFYVDRFGSLQTPSLRCQRDEVKRLAQDAWHNSVEAVKHYERAEMRKPSTRSKRTSYGTYTLVGGVHINAGDFIRLRQEKIRNILSYTKKPMTKETHIGVELEASIPRRSWDTLKTLLVESNFGEYMCLGTDGSVTSDDTYTGGELRLCAPIAKIRDVVTAACIALNKVKAKVDRSCGLHVHLDAREVLDVDAKAMFRKLVRQSLPLYLTQPASRRGNRYCKWTDTQDWEEGENGDRYKSVNPTSYHKYQTVEVRLHAGTIQAKKINYWIELIASIAYGKALKNNFQNVEPMVSALVSQGRISEACAAYFVERAKLFESAPAPVTSDDTDDYREFTERLNRNRGADIPEELYPVDGGADAWDEEQVFDYDTEAAV